MYASLCLLTDGFVRARVYGRNGFRFTNTVYTYIQGVLHFYPLHYLADS